MARRLVWLLVVLGCGSKAARPVHAPPRDALADLAAEVDPGPQPALWPQVPADLRDAVEKAAPQNLAGDARLAAARERLGNWTISFSTTDPETLVAKLERAFEGVYLAEPLALAAPGATTDAARGLLWDFYSSFAASAPLLRALSTSFGLQDPTFLRALDAAEALAKGGLKMRDHFAAELLRAKTAGKTLDDILWHHAARKRREGDAAGARGLYAELLQRRPSPKTTQDWLDVARIRVALEDAPGARDALAKATAVLAPADRIGRASLQSQQRDIAALERLQKLAPDTAPATQLARFDALLDLGRHAEAQRILDALARARPKDARVRTRHVQLQLAKGEISDKLVEGLRGDDLTDRDAMYWSVRIGAAGMAFKVAASKEALDELASAAAELAAFEPGRALAISFIMERVLPMLGGGVDEKAILRILRDSYTPALALRARYPEVADLDRIVLTLAEFHDSAATGFAAALVRPKTPPEADPELYDQRAHVLVTLAAYLGPAADLDAVQRAVEEIPPSDRDMEGGRFALLGDLELLRATRGDAAAWPRAAAQWSKALETSQAEQGRLLDNLGIAASIAGDNPRALELLQSSARVKSERRWVPLLNIATAPSTSTDERLEIVRALYDQLGQPGGKQVPALVAAWRAKLETDAATRTQAAQKALEDFASTLSFHQAELHARGIVSEGAFKLGVGLRSGRRSHDLSASAFATLWATRAMPLTKAELDALAKPPAAPKKQSGK